MNNLRKAAIGYNNPLIPTPELGEQAKSILRELPLDHPRYTLYDRATDHAMSMDLPDEVFSIILFVLSAIARNQAVNLLPTNTELTTNQAADLLNVSRGYVLQLIQKSELKCHKVGTHRRLKLEDILQYKDKMLQQTKKSLAELSAIEKDLDLDN